MIYTIRTTSGREDIVIDILSSKIRAEGLDIKALFHAAEVKGYIFVEGDMGSIHRAMHGLMHVRGLIEKPVKLEEIQHFLEYKKARIKAGVGDTVEIIGGPFKGEKGKIQRIDKAKDEVTIELLEATIPIPVTIATEFIKVLKRVKPEPEEKPKEEAEEEKLDEEKPEEEKSKLEAIVKEFKEKKEKPPEEEKSVFDIKPEEEAEAKPEETKEEPVKEKKPEEEISKLEKELKGEEEKGKKKKKEESE